MKRFGLAAKHGRQCCVRRSRDNDKMKQVATKLFRCEKRAAERRNFRPGRKASLCFFIARDAAASPRPATHFAVQIFCDGKFPGSRDNRVTTRGAARSLVRRRRRSRYVGDEASLAVKVVRREIVQFRSSFDANGGKILL